MLGFLVELFVSSIICGLLAYFLFLSAPAEELGSSPGVGGDVNGASGGAGSSDPYSTSRSPSEEELQWWAVLVPWHPSCPLFGAYCHLVVNVLGWPGAVPKMGSNSATAAATVANRRVVSGGRGHHMRGSTSKSQSHPLNPSGAVGGAGTSNGRPAPSPLRRESAHWVLALSRWLAVLLLGGGTALTEVWTSRVQYAVAKAVHSANAAWDRQLAERAAAAAATAANISGRASRAGAHDGNGKRRADSARPMLQLLHLELGPGLARESASSNLRSAVQVGAGSTGDPASSSAPAAAEACVTGSAKLNAGQDLAQWAANTAETLAAVGGPLAGTPSQVWTSEDAANLAGSQQQQHQSISVSQQQQQQQPPPPLHASSGPSSGPAFGIILPRLAGEVVSVEVPLFTVPTTTQHQHQQRASPYVSDAGDSTSRASGSPFPLSSPPPKAPPPSPPLPLRCFGIPLSYEDHRFLLRLSCCVPLGALLPTTIPIPADVLSLQCGVSVRRIRFHGVLHAAFHGPRLELTFPVAPQFTFALGVSQTSSHGSGGCAGGMGNMTHVNSGSTSGGGVGGRPARGFATAWTMRNVVATGLGSVPPPLMPQQQQQPSRHTSQQAHGGASEQQQQHIPSRPTPPAQRSEKAQEMALLTIQRALASITYPNVLEGRVNLNRGKGRGGSGSLGASASFPSDTDAADGAAPAGLISWRRTTATLPLCT